LVSKSRVRPANPAAAASSAVSARRLRLRSAWRSLQDPARRHLRVIDIAADAGFGDVTSFHRAFRGEFGRTPAQVRAETPVLPPAAVPS
jgi:AraC-like DNA-binding protein